MERERANNNLKAHAPKKQNNGENDDDDEKKKKFNLIVFFSLQFVKKKHCSQ